MLVGLIILGLAIHQIGFPFLDLIELKTYDLRVAARDTRPASGVVTLAVIDEESLERQSVKLQKQRVQAGGMHDARK